MKSSAKLGEGGKLATPADYRKSLGAETGGELGLELEEGSPRVPTPLEGIRRVKALVRAHIPAGRRLSYELVEERRREAKRE